MANLKEHYLSELRVYSSFLEDSLLAILHTIVYMRAPNEIKPQDRMCEALCPLIYATVGPSPVERDIKGTIAQLKRELTPTASSYRKEILLSFFEHREIKEWLGLVNREENVYFERWHIPLTVMFGSTPTRRHSSGTAHQATDGLPRLSDFDEEYDLNTAYRTAYDQVSKNMFAIIETVNNSTDHMPLNYNYEIQVLDAEESTRRRSTNKMPPNTLQGVA